MVEKVSAYKCKDCNMVSLHKPSVERHEKHYCRQSKTRKACGMCVHFEVNDGAMPELTGEPWSECSLLGDVRFYHSPNETVECDEFVRIK